MTANVRLGDVAIFRVTSAGTEVESSTKDDNLQLAEFYSSVGYVAERRYIDEDIFVKPPYRQTSCYGSFISFWSQFPPCQY